LSVQEEGYGDQHAYEREGFRESKGSTLDYMNVDRITGRIAACK
jgi:hypothetical protein